MLQVKATVVVPTTSNRGPLLPLSVGSILNQTISELEVFIMGDGVDNNTRKVISELQQKDSRVIFFDHPKDRRRGEIYRHQALQSAKGEIVCYLCDRDLMMPNHIEVLYGLLSEYNFASTSVVKVSQNKSFEVAINAGYLGPTSEQNPKPPFMWNIPLSSVGHTKVLYDNLPFGWRTTPLDIYTDGYMWKQFLAFSETKSFSHFEPTILYFKRGDYPGLSVDQRLLELKYWSDKLINKDSLEEIKKQILKSVIYDKMDLIKKNREAILIKGYKPNELPRVVQRLVSRLLKKPVVVPPSEIR